MMSAKPTTHPRPHEATHNPYLPSNSLASGPQPFPSFISLGNQAQSGQPHIITSPGIVANSQQGQGNVQIITPAIGTATTTFTEEAKILGVSLLTTRILILHLQGCTVIVEETFMIS